MEARLKTAFWLGALRRRYDREAIPCVVARHGDDDAGEVLLKLNRLNDGCIVFARERDLDGMLVWRAVTGESAVAEATADAYIARQTQRDPDLWVVEVEDRLGRELFREVF